ncbi:MAG: hypothetical protein WDW38_007411 [Sanguina aurantia]
MADCFMDTSEAKAKAPAEAPKTEAEAAVIASGKYTVETPRTWKEVTCYAKDGSCKALANLDRSAAQFLEYDAFREKTLKKWSSMPDYVVTRVFGGEPTQGEDGKLHKANSPLEEHKHMIVFRPNTPAPPASRAIRCLTHSIPPLSPSLLPPQPPRPPGTVCAMDQRSAHSSPCTRSLAPETNPPSLPTVTPPRAQHSYLGTLQLQDTSTLMCMPLQDFPYNLANGLTHHNLWSTQPLAPDMTQALLEMFLPGRELTWWENPTVLQSMPEVGALLVFRV